MVDRKDLEAEAAVSPRSGDGLLPCPFCGGDCYVMEHIHMLKEYAAYCGLCGTQHGQWMNSEPEAIKAWNTRASGSVAKQH